MLTFLAGPGRQFSLLPAFLFLKKAYNSNTMEQQKIIFLRHADTQKNPNVNAALWGLSDEGKLQADTVADMPVMQEVDVIYVSEEDKTSLTVSPLALRLGLKPTIMPEFNEVKRGDAFLTKEEFEAEKTKQLIDLDYPAFGGESSSAALLRFSQGVKEISTRHPEGTILIVTHGTVLNLYFASLLQANEMLPERWKKTSFVAYGIVKDGKVVKDIIS